MVAQAAIQKSLKTVDSRLRGNDDSQVYSLLIERHCIENDMPSLGLRVCEPVHRSPGSPLACHF